MSVKAAEESLSDKSSRVQCESWLIQKGNLFILLYSIVANEVKPFIPRSMDIRVSHCAEVVFFPSG